MIVRSVRWGAGRGPERNEGMGQQQSSTDPLARIFQALEQNGCEPHGQPHNFRARCPAHEGESRDALHVVEGADRRVVLHCFAHGCDPQTIVAAVGLQLGDLFPPGHRRARRRALPSPARVDLVGDAREVADVVAALDQLKIAWVVRIDVDACPYCNGQPAQLIVGSGGLRCLFCPEECSTAMFLGALAGVLHDLDAASAPARPRALKLGDAGLRNVRRLP